VVLAKNGFKSQIAKTLKDLVAKIPSITLKSTAKQPDAKTFDFTMEGGQIKFADKTKGEGMYDFVIMEAGELKIGEGHYGMSGEAASVKGAGRIYINSSGKIDYVDDYSGHYQPNRQELLDQTRTLQGAGLTAEKVDMVKTVPN
jgi:hypothetical protein